jgi:hypothetical protein
MKIRPAEPRDLRKIEEMYHKLVAYLEDCGQTLYARDRFKYENAVSGYLNGVFYDENHLVLVKEDAKGDADAFLIGRLIQYYPFFEYDLWAEVMATFPLGLHTRHLARQFELWAMERGAQGTGNYSTPGNEFAEKMFEHEGRKKVWHIYFRPFDEADYENLHQNSSGHGNGGGPRRALP